MLYKTTYDKRYVGNVAEIQHIKGDRKLGIKLILLQELALNKRHSA
jgi:hypothetical protein